MRVTIQQSFSGGALSRLLFAIRNGRPKRGRSMVRAALRRAWGLRSVAHGAGDGDIALTKVKSRGRGRHTELLAVRQLSHCFGYFGEPGVGGAALQPQSVIDGGSAADHGSGGDVVGDAALGNGYGAVSNLDVAGDAYLAGKDYVVAHIRRAGQADLGAEESVVSDGAAVAYVDHVVDL